MQQLLPNQEVISTIENKTLFFYFLKLKKADEDGAAIRQQFAKQQATCLHWLHCEYAIIGEGDDFWTHAAIFKFPNFAAVKQAIHHGISSDNVEAVQGFAVRPNNPPNFILYLFKSLLPLGRLLSRNAKKRTASEILESVEEEEIAPKIHQIERHLQNTRTSKAYMINLLHTYEKAQYANGMTSSGATAYYRKYGLVALRSVLMQGGNLILSGRMGQPVIEINAPKLTKGVWEGIGIMEYPNPAKLFTLKYMPGYDKALRHRDAGLERTVLIVSKKD